ncbi:3-oxoacyl-[acyl-carrier-protein] reductase FabG [Leucobacter aridicollis]|uniref:SDR family NAD(P)-dependent oxidoreductase n=1 Tax=Leucobacter aridicollis TaxID=283878 RepID=UPI000EB55A08|nr:SDR family NAD(P)-dependent oxidoreductase [Leucobacter aridicollis]MCS3426822.1 3-oxoacyl-[acyl-carrier protein] reductase [Leucobacter aridicollis]RKQ83780.1 3-oxoacyl-[acyl-carrier protein] reductase [Mycolicibacterium mucogenicum 261Sha1.1M5]
MAQEFAGKVSVVTGAAGGIGAEIAIELAVRGSDVLVIDVTDGSATVAAIADRTGGAVRARSEIVDIRDREAVKRCLDGVVADWGSLDVLVNNAGTAGRLSLEDMTDEVWARDLETNLTGTFLMTQCAVYPHMRDAGQGAIVNVSSISGIVGGANSGGEGAARTGPAYAASKGGVIAFTRWVAKEVGPLGITCNTVAPGPVATPMTAGVPYPVDAQPIKRIGQPTDIAQAVAFLASAGASYITGETLKVCGGTAIG